MASILMKWGYFHNRMVFRYKVLSFFIIHQDLSFGGFALKIEFVVFVYELINCLFFITTSDLQPSTSTAKQLLGQLVSTEIRTMHKNKFHHSLK